MLNVIRYWFINPCSERYQRNNKIHREEYGWMSYEQKYVKECLTETNNQYMFFFSTKLKFMLNMLYAVTKNVHTTKGIPFPFRDMAFHASRQFQSARWAHQLSTVEVRYYYYWNLCYSLINFAIFLTVNINGMYAWFPQYY